MLKMLKLHVLRKVKGHDGKLVDNTKTDWNYWKKKLKEEVEELTEAIELNDNVKIIEEVLDIVQVGIEMMYKLFKESVDIQQGIYRHNKKLMVDRWCEVAADISFHITRK